MMSKCLALYDLKLKLCLHSILTDPKEWKVTKMKSPIFFIPDCKQMNPTLFHLFILNSFKKSQIYTPYFSFEKHLNNY